MKIEKAFLIDNHKYVFRNSEKAEIIDTKIVQPDKLEARLCF